MAARGTPTCWQQDANAEVFFLLLLSMGGGNVKGLYYFNSTPDVSVIAHWSQAHENVLNMI